MPRRIIARSLGLAGPQRAVQNALRGVLRPVRGPAVDGQTPGGRAPTDSTRKAARPAPSAADQRVGTCLQSGGDVPRCARYCNRWAARTVTQLPVGPGWSFEPKYDGFRALAFRDDHGVHLQSRQLRNLTAGFPDVAAAVAQLDEAWSSTGNSWSGGPVGSTSAPCRTGSAPGRGGCAISSPRRRPRSSCSTSSRHDGRDQRDRPYRKRRRKLEKLLARGLPDGLVLTPATTDAAVARSWMLGHATGIELRAADLAGEIPSGRGRRGRAEVPCLSRRTARRPR